MYHLVRILSFLANRSLAQTGVFFNLVLGDNGDIFDFDMICFCLGVFGSLSSKGSKLKRFSWFMPSTNALGVSPQHSSSSPGISSVVLYVRVKGNVDIDSESRILLEQACVPLALLRPVLPRERGPSGSSVTGDESMSIIDANRMNFFGK